MKNCNHSSKTPVIAGLMFLSSLLSVQAQVRTKLDFGNDDGSMVYSMARQSVNRLLEAMNTAYASGDRKSTRLNSSHT